jgi:hypothetical protein
MLATAAMGGRGESAGEQGGEQQGGGGGVAAVQPAAAPGRPRAADIPDGSDDDDRGARQR